MERTNEQIHGIVKRGRGRPKKIVDPNDADELQPQKLGRPEHLGDMRKTENTIAML